MELFAQEAGCHVLGNRLKPALSPPYSHKIETQMPWQILFIIIEISFFVLCRQNA